MLYSAQLVYLPGLRPAHLPAGHWGTALAAVLGTSSWGQSCRGPVLGRNGLGGRDWQAEKELGREVVLATAGQRVKSDTCMDRG